MWINHKKFNTIYIGYCINVDVYKFKNIRELNREKEKKIE